MSDVEKAIFGSVDDEQRQQQQQQPLQYNTITENLNTIPDNKNVSVTILNPYTGEEQYNTENNHTKKYQLREEKGNNYQKEYELTIKEDGKHYTHRKVQRRQQHREGTGGARRARARGRGEEEGIQEDEEEEAEGNVRYCLGGIIKLFLSTPGLVALVVLYSIMGALIFPLLEAPADINKSALIAKSRDECLKELWIITEKLNVLYERNWTMLVHEQLRRFEGTIVAATRNNVIQQSVGASMVGKAQDSDISSSTSGIGGSHGLMLTADSSNALFGHSAPTPDPLDYTSRWSFSEALLYSVTVITTIGQGSLTPRTAGGKIATILYALIGVPLTLMCLSSLGTLLADALQCTYARLCCRFAQCEVNTGVSNKATNAMAEKQASNNSKRKYHQHYMAAVITTNNDDDVDDDNDDDDKPLRQQKFKNVYHPMNNYNIQSQGSGSDYKTYKYDALLDASYYHREEDDDENYKQQLQSHTSHMQGACCRPWLNNGAKAKCQKYEQTACQQLKIPTDSTMRTQFQQQQQQQQHQHQHQQQQQQQQYRRDIMLTTEEHKLSSSPTMLRGGGTYTNTLAGVSIDGMGVSGVTHSLISSPQRYFVHPSTVATYHVVANAVNESNIRPVTHISNQQQQQQQHFMTITSNALRFPDTTIKDTHRGATADAQLGMPKQQTATIYVPVITNNSSTTSTSSQSQNNNSSSDSMLSKSSFMKYQTIQLPEQASYGLTSYITNTLVNQQTMQQSREEQEEVTPPPPASQTTTAITKATATPTAAAAEIPAQQHGTLRRAKFLTKPLPPEINKLLHENDLYGNYDIMQQPLQQQQQQNTFFLSSVLQRPTPTELIVNTTLSAAVDIKSVETMLTTTTTTHTNTNNNNTSVSTGFVSDSSSTSTAYSVLLSTLVPTTITTITPTPTPTTPSTTTSVSNSYNNEFCSTSTLMPNNIHPYAIVTTTTTTTTATSVSPAAAAAATIVCTNCKSSLVNKCESHESKTTTTTTTISVPVVTSALAPLYMNSHTQLHDCSPVMATDATLVLDIIEDEDAAQQHQHLDNCPHGTPSRMPLLPTSSSTKLTTSAQAATLGASTIHDNEKRTFQFHRPNLTTFHRTNGILTQQQQHQQQRNQLTIVPATVSVQQQQQHFPCKSLIINRKGECNLHTPPPQPQRRASMSGLCYGNFRTADHTDTSEDEMITLTNGQDTYKLQNLQTDSHLDVDHDYELDNNSLVSLQPVLGIDDPQVPMSLVLLILIFYVCLGTMIFALWENWTLIDGAYFCFVTLTTIGYGDFLPARTFNGPQIQLFACCAYLLLGLVLVAMSFSVLETQLMWKCKRLAVRLKLTKD